MQDAVLTPRIRAPFSFRMQPLYFAGAAVVLGLFFYLFYTVPVMWDDWGRYYMGEGILPAWRFALNYYQHSGGRLFGSFFSILFLKYRLLYAIIGSLLLASLSILCASFLHGKRLWIFLLTSALVVCTPLPVLKQTYTWICGFGYYMIPLPAVLLFLYLERKTILGDAPVTTIGGVLAGVVCGALTQLFVENASIMALGAGVAITGYSLIVHRRINGTQIAFTAVCAVGTVIMFLSPAYQTLGQTPEWMSMNLLQKAVHQAPKVLSGFLADCWPAISIFTFLLCIKLYSSKLRKVTKLFLALVLASGMGASILHTHLLQFHVLHIADPVLFLLYLVAAVLTLAWTVEDKGIRRMLLFLFGIGLFSGASLLMASYFGARNFLYWNFFLVIILCILTDELLLRYPKVIKTFVSVLLAAAVVYGGLLFLAYYNAARIDAQRSRIVEIYMQNPTGKITVPKMSTEFLYAPNPSTDPKNYHNIVFKKYYKLPQDVQLVMK